MPSMEALFYIILLSQIYLLSYHYPMVNVKRVTYILDNYPAKDYPKLYPSDTYINPEDITRKRINFFKNMNFAIALIGIAILIIVIFNDFELNEKGGAEIFVVMYFLFQFIPHFMLEIYQSRHNKHMSKLLKNTKRTADLTPRKLSDFISPIWVILAGLLFILSTVLFLYFKGFDKAWAVEVYISVIVSSAVNVMFIFIGYNIINGKKTNPMQAHNDQLITIKASVGIMVFASIMMSLFLITINSVREFGLDKWEPLLMSVYFQLVAIFGIGKKIHSVKLEDVDFEVYRA